MDHRTFDRLTRALGARAHRRNVLAGVVGLSLGTAGRVGDAAATMRRQTCRAFAASCTRNAQCCSQSCLRGSAVPRNLRNRCGCPDGQTWCGTTCHDLSSDVAHCGECGNACEPPHTCGVSAGTPQCLGPCEDPSRYPTTQKQCVATVEGPEAFGDFIQTTTQCTRSDECSATVGGADMFCGTAMGMVMVDPNGNWTVVTPAGEPTCYDRLYDPANFE